jgi:hypothetical protein
MTKEEKKVRARLENLVSGGAGTTNNLSQGRHEIEKLADIPKYFKISKLKERQPPGKITI